MTSDDLRAWLLLAGFMDRGLGAYSLSSKSLWVIFNTYDITIQKRGDYPDDRWTTFRTSTQAAFDFIKEQIS